MLIKFAPRQQGHAEHLKIMRPNLIEAGGGIALAQRSEALSLQTVGVGIQVAKNPVDGDGNSSHARHRTQIFDQPACHRQPLRGLVAAAGQIGCQDYQIAAGITNVQRIQIVDAAQKQPRSHQDHGR